MKTLTLESVAAALKSPASIPAQVADGLRVMILRGELRPGDRVVEWRIARQLGIGQPTAREALLVLETEGLLLRSPNRGCTVTKLSVSEIDQIYRVRMELEPLAAELAAENADNWKPAVLKTALANLHKAAKAGDIEQWRQADLAFHRTIWSLANNPFLEKALTPVAIPFFAFAGMVFHQTQPKDLRRQAKEHDPIAKAILAGDKAEARAVTAEVLRNFRAHWLAISASPEAE